MQDVESNDDQDTAGYKIVIDNVDKNVRPRYMTFEKRTQSLHYCNGYAVKDRVNTSQLSDTPPLTPESISTEKLMPSKDDESSVLQTFKVLVSRLATHIL